MKRFEIHILLAVLFCAALLIGASTSYSAIFDSKVTWDQLPLPVREKIALHGSGVKPEKIEKETKNGKTVYQAQLRLSPDHLLKMNVRGDGRLLEFEPLFHDHKESVRWIDIPAAVKKTVTGEAHGGKVEIIEKITKDGKEFYSIQVDAPDFTVVSMKIDPEGTLMKLDTSLDWFYSLSK